MIRFLHTSDWQLGMTRHFLSDGAQERYTQARFDAIRTMGRVANDEKCQFMLGCGDAFESNQVDRKTVARALYTAGLPDPDLLIRTSGEMRISNFLLWQVCYAEIYVTRKCWPDFSKAQLRRAIQDYQERQRRFGGLHD